MKRILTMVTAIIFTASLSAVAGEIKPTDKKQALYEMTFSRLKVQDGIDILLVESSSKAIEFSGAEADVDKVQWNIKNGVMTISSKKGSLKGKVKLVVNVRELDEIYVGNGAEVSSYGKLNSPLLKVYVEGDAYISLRSTGDISVITAGDTEMDIKTATERVFFR